MVYNFNSFEPLFVTSIHLPTVRHIVMLTHRSLCSGKAAAKPKPSDTSAQQAPQLVTALKDSQVNEGEAVTMSCKILAVPGACRRVVPSDHGRLLDISVRIYVNAVDCALFMCCVGEAPTGN